MLSPKALEWAEAEVRYINARCSTEELDWLIEHLKREQDSRARVDFDRLNPPVVIEADGDRAVIPDRLPDHDFIKPLQRALNEQGLRTTEQMRADLQRGQGS